MALFESSSHIISAVRFTSLDVTVVKLDLETHKLISLAQAPLPKDTISHGLVTSPQQLNPLVKSLVVQTKSSGTDTIIGFPEDKIFTTLITIPEVSSSDLDEAIYWQAEEILPTDISQVYFDWKEVPSVSTTNTTTPHQALLMSVPQAVLDPFVAPTIAAGLKPVSCEPTSLSLSRLAPRELCLIAEVRRADSTLVICDQSQIVLLSTVVDQPTQVVAEAKRMLDFFFHKHNRRVSSLHVCGEGATQDWQVYLKNQIQLPVNQLPLPPLANLPANATQFTVSLSLAHKPPLPPHSPKTINLLPKTLEHQYEVIAEKKSLNFGFRIATIATLVTAIIMFAGFGLIQLRLRTINSQISTEEQAASQTNYNELAKTAEAANAQARLLKRLPPQDNLGEILVDLQAAVPPGVSLDSFSIDIPEKVLLVNGLALTRDHLLRFKASLEQSNSFQLVTIPLPTLETKDNIQFSIAVDLKPIK